MIYYPHQVLLLSFKLRRKTNKYFVLKNYATIRYKSSQEINSNTVTVYGLRIRPAFKDNWCGTPHWRV